MYICIHICVCAYIYIYICVLVYLYMCISMYVYVYEGFRVQVSSDNVSGVGLMGSIFD